MKKVFIYLLITFSYLITYAQNVGIGTNLPKARLHVSDSSVVFTGGSVTLPTIAGNPPITGSGTRMMWYVDKAAFRVGAVSGGQWNKDSIGTFSFAAGLNAKAHGGSSISLGNNTTAIGNWSTSIGFQTNASGEYSTSLGYRTLASGDYSTSMGYQTNASGYSSTSIGRANEASGYYSTCIGLNNKAKAYVSFTAGLYNDEFEYPDPGIEATTDRIFQIGNGKTNILRHNALTILRNGNTGLGTTLPQATLHVNDGSVVFTAPITYPPDTEIDPPVSSPGARMMWYSGKAAFRTGLTDLPQWDDKDSIGFYSFASGYNTKASGLASISMGSITTASGVYSTSMGSETVAIGNSSTSLGSKTIAKAVASLAIGRYNDISDNPDPTAYSNSDRVFQIGNGTVDSDRRNALTVLRNGNIGIGTVTPSAPLSFASSFGTKISLFRGSYGDVGIGVEGGELRLQNDIPNGKVSMGVIETTSDYTELARAQRSGVIAFTINGSLSANGSLYASDERFKQNIVAISSPLQKIQQINGVEYEMRVGEFPQKHFMPGRQIGLIAQNVEKVIPEAVSENEGYKGVDYAKLVPLLIEGIKEQQKQIEASNEEVKQIRQQQKQFETSSEEVKQLQQQVAELKKLVEQLLKK